MLYPYALNSTQNVSFTTVSSRSREEKIEVATAIKNQQ
jgi:hypothetical protein